MDFKRTVYLALSMALGIIVSYGVHAVVELWYLGWAETKGRTVVWASHFGAGQCALPWCVQYGLLAAGVVAGFLIGRVWWRIVYVEHRHWIRRK